MKQEALTAGLFKVTACRLQQIKGADDVRLNKCSRPINGAVYMGFGGKMYHPVRLETVDDLLHGSGIADVGPYKGVAVTASHRRH